MTVPFDTIATVNPPPVGAASLAGHIRYPDSGTRLVLSAEGPGLPFRHTGGIDAVIYIDEAGTVLAPIRNNEGNLIPNSTVEINKATSRFPLFWAPNQYSQLWTRIAGQAPGLLLPFSAAEYSVIANDAAQAAALSANTAVTSANAALTAANQAIALAEAPTDVAVDLGIDRAIADGSIGASTGASVPAADYVLYRTGAEYRLTSSTATQTGSEPGALLQIAMNALGAAGGTILFAGTQNFEWGSIPKLTRDVTGKLILKSTGGAKILLSLTAPRFLDFSSQSQSGLDVDVVHQNIELDGFVIDAAGTQTITTANHIVIGNLRAGAGTKERQNYRNITVRNIRVLNIATTLAAGVTQYPIYFVTLHNGPDQPQNFIDNILIEDCDWFGSRTGIQITGHRLGGTLGTPNIVIDNIVIRRVRHIIPTPPLVFAFSAHIHIGSSFGKVGKVTITDCYGYGSRDVGIELNNFQEATVERCVMEDTYGIYFFGRNFFAPTRPNDQVYRIIDCTGRALNTGAKCDSQASSFVCMRPDGLGLPRLIVENFQGYCNRPDLLANGILDGLAFRPIGAFTSIHLRNFRYLHEGIAHASAASVTYFPFSIEVTDATPLIFDNVSLYFKGVVEAGAGAVSLWPIVHRAGSSIIDWSNLDIFMEVTNVTSSRLIDFGSGVTTKGGVRKSRFATIGGTTVRGVVIGNATNHIIPTTLRFDDNDFSGMSPSADILFISATENRDKVHFSGNIWRLGVKPTVTVAALASPWIYRNLEGSRVEAAIVGGTVSEIAYSRDNVTYTVVATATGAVFTVDPGDYLRLTYTAAPALRVIPGK